MFKITSDNYKITYCILSIFGMYVKCLIPCSFVVDKFFCGQVCSERLLKNLDTSKSGL